MGAIEDPELLEWLYGPYGGEDPEPESVGEMYHRQEEEDRIRWLPGYAQLVKDWIAETRRWHSLWKPGCPYPPEPERHRELWARLSEQGKIRVQEPWEHSAPER